MSAVEVIAQARLLGLKVEWEIDVDPIHFVDDDEEALCAHVMHPTQKKCLASLGSIIVKAPSFIRGVAQDAYLVEIEHDLLYEAMSNWKLERDREVADEAEALGARATYAG